MADPISPFVAPIVKCGITKAYEMMCYAWNYKRYVTGLSTQKERLVDLLYDVEQEVEEAESQINEISKQAANWKKLAEAKVNESESFLKSLVRTPASCTHDCNCNKYKVAKKAETLTNEIKLLVDGNKPKTHFEWKKPAPMASTWEERYVALDSREKLKDGLHNGLREGKLVMGIWGVEGVGKTTLAKKFAAEIERGVEYAVVITSLTNKEAVHSIQQEIAERIGFKLTVQTINERAAELREKLARMRKVLIVLDHVEKLIELNDIGIPTPRLDNGCRIVLVSKSSQLCTTMRSEMNFQVEQLTQGEALILVNGLSKLYPREKKSIADANSTVSSKEKWLPANIKQLLGLSNLSAATTAIGSPGAGGKRSLILYADALDIVHSDKSQNWTFTRTTSSSEAILIQVSFLQIMGKARNLLPRTKYGAYFVYQLSDNAKGFKLNQVEMIVGKSSKRSYLDPSRAKHDILTRREDDWMEIEMGTFYTDDFPNFEVDLLVRDLDTSIVKSGLRVRGIELRPLDTN